MPEVNATQNGKSNVFLLPTSKKYTEHEYKVHEYLGEKIAGLLAASYKGIYPLTKPEPKLFYFIPNDTLTDKAQAKLLGIESEKDFFGGFVAQPYMATKAISHPLIEPDAQAPIGWSEMFSRNSQDVVLKGYTAFNLKDMQRAGVTLLRDGTFRVKSVSACAGRGQVVISNLDELAAIIAVTDENEIAACGVVLEENLTEVATFSVGQAMVADILISYVGTQQLTRDNHGESVYGGSTLTIARGNYNELLRLNISEKKRLAISQAQIYEHCALQSFPDFIASRRNYDVAQGLDVNGNFCSGVLEQSWRIGGASGAEIFALAAFAADPSLQQIRASTHEIYGQIEMPDHTALLYQGEDPEVGFITKFVRVEPYVN